MSLRRLQIQLDQPNLIIVRIGCDLTCIKPTCLMMESLQSTQHGTWNDTTSKNLKFFGQPALQLVECGETDNQRDGRRQK